MAEKASKKTKAKTKTKALDNKCPACRAQIHFNPTLQKWKCEYCDSEFTLEELQKFNNASNEQNNKIDENVQVDENNQTNNNFKTEDATYISYKCENCGAEIVADEQTSATFCVYCGSTAILRNKLVGKFKPDLIIPFKVKKEVAVEKFQKLSKGRPFMPKGFNDKNNIEKIKGVYIPFWLYDFDVEGGIDCNAVKIRSWTSGDRRYTKTDTFRVSRAGNMTFLKVPVDGSTRFNNDIMNSIEPFNYDEIVPYNHAYLSGFFAERYDEDSDKTCEEARQRALNTGKDIMLNDCVGYTSKTITSNTLKTKDTKVKYALLPVWMVNVKFKDKMYPFAMNGQTGEFIGDIPIDNKKVVIRTILTFVVACIIFIAVTFLFSLVVSL